MANTSAPQYLIRLARPEELPALQKIERAAAVLFIDTPYSFLAVSDPTPLQVFLAQHEKNLVWVAAKDEAQPVGFAVVRVLDGAAYLHEMDVDPQHSRRGLGRRLVQAVCAWAQRENISALTLSTFSDVLWNAPFYEKLGFRILADEELSPGLRAVRRQEAQAGFPMTKRVCMRLDLGSGDAGQSSR